MNRLFYPISDIENELKEDEPMKLEQFKCVVCPVKQNFQKWIPVNKRVPENNTPILISDDTGYVLAVHYYDWATVLENHRVVAWMPLPEPYKEGE